MINAEIIRRAKAVKEIKIIEILNAKADRVAAVDKAKVVKVAVAVNRSKVVVKVIKAIVTSNNTSFMHNK
jgi:hypothetical protein